tara:strand:- start:1 stop:210 length:210 start_codon:yes stop_codon:yes gene_type:complete
MNVISEEMYEVMIHMIGYGFLEEHFTDAIDSCDHKSLVELARICNNRWGGGCVDVEKLERAIERYNKEE